MTNCMSLDDNNKTYAQQIVRKYEKFEEDISQYSAFIILCDASKRPLISNHDEILTIRDYALEQKHEMKGVSVAIVWSSDGCVHTEMFTF